MTEKGYIKYNCIWNNLPIKISESELNSLNLWRKKLYEKSLIGIYNNGIGFGNISLKTNLGFFITGSATGGKRFLYAGDYALVTNWQFDKNQLYCTGKTKASSESLTHAAIYESDNEINAVIHVHSAKMWDFYLNKLPTTAKEIEYGTPEMAMEFKKLLKDKSVIEIGIVVMGGHEEGLVSFGKSLKIAGNQILKYYYQSLNN